MSARLAKRLVEPDFWTCPHGVRGRPRKVMTYGPEVAEVCADANFPPDPQQQLGLDLVFAIKPDGSPATFEFCVICSRQNLKTGLFLQCAIGWLYVLDIPEIAWSAHELSTARASQRDLANIIRNSKTLRKRMLPQKNEGVYDANGEERIELRNPETGEDQVVWYKARTRDGGRGLAKPKLVLDEAFALRTAMMGSIIPILLAQHHPQVVMGSSPGKADSEVLFDVRHRGRNHLSPAMSYLEWGGKPLPPCEDPDCTHPKTGLAYGAPCVANRIEVIEARNPTLTTGRITIDTLANIRQVIPNADEWFRECMGRWDEPGEGMGPPAIDTRRWSRLAEATAPAPRRVAVVLDVEPDRSATTIGVVGAGPRGTALGLVDVHEFEGDAIEALLALKANVDVLEVAFHPSGQAGTLAPALKKAGIEFKELVHKDMGRGCSALLNATERGTFTHVGQLELDIAAGSARTRKVNEILLWDRGHSPVPLGPVVAVSVALQRWLELTAKPDSPPPPPVKSDRPAAQSRAHDIAHVGF